MVSLGDTAISLHILQPPLNWGGGVLESQNPKCQDLPKFQFSAGGEGGGGVGLKQIPEQGVLRILSTNFALPLSGCLCITDSLSHITYVETN